MIEMSGNFTTCINRLLGAEGGYVNNPTDPGGETNWGISKRSYPNLDIKNLTRDQAAALYHRDFWAPFSMDDLKLDIAFQMLDFAVNSGSSTASRACQRALNVADDGHIGPITLEKLKVTEPHIFAMRLLAQRLRFMVNCKNWPNASRGWSIRIANNLEYGAEDV